MSGQSPYTSDSGHSQPRRILRNSAEEGGKILHMKGVHVASQVLRQVKGVLLAERDRVVLHWFTCFAAVVQCAVGLGSHEFSAINRNWYQYMDRTRKGRYR